MPKPTQPITTFVRDNEEAVRLAGWDPDSRALTSGVGTLKFHMLIAQHGAGEFKTLYVPLAMRYSFRSPAGGIVNFADGGEG